MNRNKRISFIAGYSVIELASCVLTFPACFHMVHVPAIHVLISVLLIFLFSIIRVTRWCKHSYRDAMMAYILISINVLMITCRMSSFLLATVGTALWFTNPTRTKKRFFDRLLMFAVLLLTSIASFPLVADTLKNIIPNRYLIAVIPVVLVWLKQSFELLSWEYRDFSLELHAEEPGEKAMKVKKVLDSCFYYILFGMWYTISKIPFFIWFTISTIVSAFLYHIVRYRRHIVHKNIKDSFPDKSTLERFKISRTYYLHFCDLVIESIKYFSISEKELRKRLVYTNIEEVRESLRRGKTVGLYLGHYGNWEWISSLPLQLADVGQCCQLYHPLENRVLDRLVAYTRERWGGVNIPAAESIRHIIRLKNQGRPLIIGFIADQVPLWNNIHYWTDFLNHKDTPVFTGAERLMKKLDMDVYYVDARKVKRGYYEITFKLITKTPKECPEFQITEEYTRMLEHTINEAPPYWLWSHKRWKRTREEYNRIFGVKENA